MEYLMTLGSFKQHDPQNHWMILKICPMALSQCCFDSLDHHINSNTECIYVSRILHAWILDYFHATMSDNHPNKNKWSQDNIIYLSSVLDNLSILDLIVGFICG